MMTNNTKPSTLDPSPSLHKSILKEEVIDALALKNTDVFVDTTVNGGGHSREIAERFKGIKIICIDADKKALERAEKNIGGNPILVESNFRHLDKVLHNLKIETVDKVLFDLGLSSDQLEHSGRGFSFRYDEPLQMTFKVDPAKSEVTAYDVVNNFEENNLESILRGFGEERMARKIARVIVEQREKSPIKTSGELAKIIESAIRRRGKIHPATKTFQAIRITVNDELRAIEEGLYHAWQHLKANGRIAVISFHSLEDRIVKKFMKEKVALGVGKLISKKPIVPSAEEIKENPRARSAKLRIIEKQ